MQYSFKSYQNLPNNDKYYKLYTNILIFRSWLDKYRENIRLYLMKHRLKNDVMMFINKYICPEKLVKDIAMQIIRSIILLTSHQAVHKEYTAL